MNGWKIFGISMLILLIIFGIGACSVINGVIDFGVKTGKDVVRKTADSDNILYNYNNFYNIYEGLKGVKNNIDSIDNELKQIEQSYNGKYKSEWLQSDVERYNFIKDSRNGLVQNYNRNASDYNSNAQKITSKYFKDWNLPDKIDLIL